MEPRLNFTVTDKLSTTGVRAFCELVTDKVTDTNEGLSGRSHLILTY
jgi:hypothetical protein